MLGGPGNINGVQIFPNISKGIHSQMSTRGRSTNINGHNLVNIVYERPLTSLLLNYFSNNRTPETKSPLL